MKRIVILFFIALVLLTSESAFSQTASDYYTPLGIGNHVTLHTVSIGTNSRWGFRTTSYTIEGADSIIGRKFYRERAIDVMDETRDTTVFRVFWLRKDSVGNVVLGALNTSNMSSNVDSAMVVNAGNWFPNGFLTKGFSVSNPWGNVTIQDSVLSVTETVNATTGTFPNCIEIMESQFNSSGTVVFREYHYYAYGIGMVKNVRTVPDTEANTSELTSYGTTGISTSSANHTPQKYSLSQNYPNPFNPSTQISYQVPSSSRVSLKVFDVLGREVATLVNEVKPAGTYTATFNANSIPSGVYFYRLQSGSFTETKRLVLIK